MLYRTFLSPFRVDDYGDAQQHDCDTLYNVYHVDSPFDLFWFSLIILLCFVFFSRVIVKFQPFQSWQCAALTALEWLARGRRGFFEFSTVSTFSTYFSTSLYAICFI
jgi:hypothetical protein